MSDFRSRLEESRSGAPLLMVVPGSGLIARCAVESKADALMVLNAGIYRSIGAGTLAAFLPYGNANDQTVELLKGQMLPRSGGLPIIAGVFGVDPTRPIRDRLRELQDLGVIGVVNWPAIGFIDGEFRDLLEREGLGIEAEAEMLGIASEMGFVTFGFSRSVQEVQHFVATGVDGLILNIGLTRSSDDFRAKRDDVHRAISELNKLLAAADTHPDCVRVAFGGPITAATELSEVFRHCAIHGFAGGSVFERLPVQDIVNTTLRRFRGVSLSARTGGAKAFGGMVGQSPAMRQMFDIINRVGPQDVTVCVEGETGTGKELVAGMLHRLSSRANHPLVTLNCGAIPSSLLESELFGHERGAFTGAERQRPGKFELAHGGVLFLDEIADLSPHGQVALLRVLQQNEVVRVGGDTTIPVDVRIVTASNRSLAAMVDAGDFRADLFYRLSTITIRLPALRERLDDIPLLVEAFLANLRTQLNRPIAGISSRFEKNLLLHSWPGNIRELEQVLNRCAILEDGTHLEGWSFEPQPYVSLEAEEVDGPPPSKQELAQRALQDANGNVTRAAAALSVTRKTFYRWLDRNKSSEPQTP